MQDRFETINPGLDSPSSHGFSVVPHDSTDFAEVTRAIYVGNGGTISLVMMSGAVLQLSGVSGGSLLPLRVRRINATGTTASGLVGLV